MSKLNITDIKAEMERQRHEQLPKEAVKVVKVMPTQAELYNRHIHELISIGRGKATNEE